MLSFSDYEKNMYLFKSEAGGIEKVENKSLMISFLKGNHFKYFDVLKCFFLFKIMYL